MYRRRTLRQFPTHTRKLARAVNDLEANLGTVKRLIKVVQQLERDSRALGAIKARAMPQQGTPDEAIGDCVARPLEFDTAHTTTPKVPSYCCDCDHAVPSTFKDVTRPICTYSGVRLGVTEYGCNMGQVTRD